MALGNRSKTALQRVGPKMLVPALFGLAAVLLILAGTSGYGAGITHDSAAYIYAAKSFISGKGFVYFGYETPFVQWPPMFPALLGFTAAIGLDPAAAGRYINALAFGFIVFYSGIWLMRHVKSFAAALAGQAILLFAIPVVYVSQYIWSEPLFILFAMLFLFKLGDIPERDKPADVIPAAVFAALACLTRYMGTAAVMTGVLFLLFRKGTIAKRLSACVLFGSVASVPLLLWMGRNYAATGTLTGFRTPSQFTLVENMKLFIKIAASWFAPVSALPDHAVKHAAFIVLTVIGCFTAAALCMFYLKRGPAAGAGKAPNDALPGGIALLAVYSAVYTAHLVISSSRVAIDAIDNRLLAPVYIPVALLVVIAIDRVSALLREQSSKRILSSKRMLHFFFTISTCTWLLYSAAASCTMVYVSAADGAQGYSSGKWRQSELINYLVKNKPDEIKPGDAGPGGGRPRVTVYSNYPGAIYIKAGIPARFTPKKQGAEIYGFERFKRLVESDGYALLAWFGPEASGGIYGVEDLKDSFLVEEVAAAADGRLYVLKPSEPG